MLPQNTNKLMFVLSLEVEPQNYRNLMLACCLKRSNSDFKDGSGDIVSFSKRRFQH